MKKQAFSLVELSIVLVILGLLTGGILAGQSLIRASELRAVITESQRYTTAIQSFRDKYFANPGDMNNATAFWGRLNSNADCISNSSAAVASPGACDGNSDGLLNSSGAASQSGESFQLWRHLALAGFIEGSYSGIAGSSTYQDSTIGVNVPKSKMTNGGWFFFQGNNYPGSTAMYALDYGNAVSIGGAVSGSWPSTAILKPEEAWNIDTKIDDGKPAYGRVIARYWNNACATGGASNTDLANSVYNLSNSTIQCVLYFTKQF